MLFLGILIGAVIGAGGMFFVVKNNKKQFEAAAAEMDAKHEALKARFK